MKSLLFTVFTALFCVTAVCAQNAPAEPAATKPVQQSEQPSVISANPDESRREVKVPAGTPLEIEAAYTVSSVNVKRDDAVSFRLLIPIKIEGVTVIEKDALVTGRIVKAKRGGRWGKAGKLSWTMIDVIAVDLSRVPVTASKDHPDVSKRIRGISRGGEVAARTIMLGALFPPAAAIAVIGGAFRRGGDAVLPEGARFVVYVQKDTTVAVPVER